MIFCRVSKIDHVYHSHLTIPSSSHDPTLESQAIQVFEISFTLFFIGDSWLGDGGGFNVPKCQPQALAKHGRNHGQTWAEIKVSWVIGVPLVIIHFWWGFSIINLPFWGTTICGNPQIEPTWALDTLNMNPTKAKHRMYIMAFLEPRS